MGVRKGHLQWGAWISENDEGYPRITMYIEQDVDYFRTVIKQQKK